MKNLIELYLGNNRIKFIDESIGELKYLKVLDLQWSE